MALLMCLQLGPSALPGGASSEQAYLFHPDMADLVYLGKTLPHLYCASFSFQ